LKPLLLHGTCRWQVKTKKKGSKFSDCVATKDGKSLFLIQASSRFVVRIDLATGMKSAVGDDLGTKELKDGKAVEAEGKILDSQP